MKTDEATPFATIESALEFMHLLNAAIAETVADVQEDIVAVQRGADPRRADALQLVDYKLQQLSVHIGKGERLLKELRRLRDLILRESKANVSAASVR